MAKRTAEAHWDGPVQDGSGNLKLGSGSYEGAYSFKSRFEEGDGTNPEELIGAALAGCFSMALSAGLTQNETPPESIDTTAEVEIKMEGSDIFIPTIHLKTRGRVPDIDEETFQAAAEAAKNDCPVSKALSGVNEITLEATLEGGDGGGSGGGEKQDAGDKKDEGDKKDDDES